MSDTIKLIDTSDKTATEAMRQMLRRLYVEPNNVAFRRAFRSPVQASNYQWVTLGGIDPLPEVLDPPMCPCGEKVAEDEYKGQCYECFSEAELEDAEGPE